MLYLDTVFGMKRGIFSMPVSFFIVSLQYRENIPWAAIAFIARTQIWGCYESLFDKQRKALRFPNLRLHDTLGQKHSFHKFSWIQVINEENLFLNVGVSNAQGDTIQTSN